MNGILNKIHNCVAFEVCKMSKTEIACKRNYSKFTGLILLIAYLTLIMIYPNMSDMSI